MEAAALRESRRGTLHARAESMPAIGNHERQRMVAWLFGGTAATLFFLMAIGGVLMRLNQAEAINLGPEAFYRIMTLHGAGMIVTAVIGTSGGLWYVVRDTLPLSVPRMLAAWLFIVLGALIVLISTLLLGFASAWTFLWPLPFMSAGQWGDPAAAGYLLGLALVAVGFLIFSIDLVTKTIRHYGSLSRACGWAYLRDHDDSPPPPPVLAAFVIGVQGIVTTTMAFPVVFAQLTRAIEADTYINALWAKELTYQYGHTLANLTIYLGAGMVYVLLPRYVGRPWKTTKPIAFAWLATFVIVLTAYFHHLYMDFAQPVWMSMIGMVASSAAAVPVAVVTMYTGLMLVWGSKFRWTLAGTLFFLGFFGWAVGGVGAVMDSLIPLNFRLHNTLWVPAHFHSYMLLGVVLWILALVTHLFERAAGRPSSQFTSVAAPSLILGGGVTFIGMWYISGAAGVPRRYAEHFGGVQTLDAIASVGAIVLLFGVVLIFFEWAGLAAAARGRSAAEKQPASPAPYEPTVSELAPPQAMIETRGELIAVIAALTFSLVSFLPWLDTLTVEKVQWHHVQHGGQLAFGMLLAIAFVNTPSFAKLRCRSESLAIVALVLGSAAMFALMIPALYESLENNDLVHMLFHLCVMAVGIVVGWAITAFDRFSAWLLFLMMATMGFAYGAGVGIV